ncbi:DUF6518 family protein [Streptomyces sp. NPDC086010]|uniref:DUF6518 family protein n=1 Tax=Streptomyces sp. NPDC086010 TaxID=3365745 RepID=UPI0037D2ED2A
MTHAATLFPPLARTRWVYALVAALAGGLSFGVLTNLGQGWLPGGINQLCNSGAVWSAAAFAAGALLASRMALPVAAATGLLTELALVVGYYGYAEYGFNRAGAGDLTWPLVWAGMAVITGPLFGVAGAWARHGGKTLRRTAGIAALSGVFGAEGIFATFDLGYPIQAAICGAVLILLPLLMARSLRARALALSTAVIFSILAYVVVYSQPVLSG